MDQNSKRKANQSFLHIILQEMMEDPAPPPKKTFEFTVSITCLKPSPTPNLLIKIFYCLFIEEEKA
jgi:hypothetical protein